MIQFNLLFNLWKFLFLITLPAKTLLGKLLKFKVSKNSYKRNEKKKKKSALSMQFNKIKQKEQQQQKKIKYVEILYL